jgi:UDP-glucose 4-epimerase
MPELNRTGRILVTGGAGFVGSHLVDELVSRTNARIIVVDNLYRGSAEWIEPHIARGRVEFIKADIRDLQALAEAMRGSGIVFHLAALSNVIGASQSLEYSFTANVVGTFNVLQAARAQGVERVVFTSSREVYGQPDAVPVSEDAPVHAKNAYGASKISAEQYCAVFRENYGLDVRVLRLANVYGPRDRGRVIPLFCEAFAQRQPLIIYGGQQIIDFVWIGDVIRALLDAVQIPEWPGPMNVGSGSGVTVLELAHRMRSLIGQLDWPLDLRSPRSIEVGRFVANLARMRHCLGWIPSETALGRLAEVMIAYGLSPEGRPIAAADFDEQN